jgi:hypothetical protein
VKSRRWGTLLLVAVMLACGSSHEPPLARREPPATSRQLGSWKGHGDTTLGFISESGSFRITWAARNTESARPGTFHLTLRSGISGRPMKVIADSRGASAGSVEFGDDPRMYEFLVEASGIDWSISVEETLAPRTVRP